MLESLFNEVAGLCWSNIAEIRKSKLPFLLSPNYAPEFKALVSFAVNM